VTLDAINK